MRSPKLLVLMAIILFTFMVGCSSDDSTTPPPPAEAPMSESLEEYWSSSEDMSSSMAGLTSRMADIDAAVANLGSGNKTIAEIDAMVAQFYTESMAAAAHFDVLIALEDNIHGYGSDKGMFTDLVTGVVRGVYNTGKKVVVSSGQMVRTSWRVLSGSHSLREAIRATDSGIPIVSDMAKRLKEHNAQKDDAIINAILSGDHHEGSVPIGDLQGSTAEERANYYRNLSDEDPLKKRTRGDVSLWSSEERMAISETLKKAGIDGVKTYVGAVSGSDALAEVGEQLTTQEPSVDVTVHPDIQRALDNVMLAGPKTMIINLRNQPEDEPKMVILKDVSPEFEVDLPTGEYDIIVLAEDYVRSAVVELEVAAGQAADVLFEMYEYAANSVILESVTADYPVAIIDETVTVTAVAATVVGGAVTFDWVIEGGAFSNFSKSGSSCSFVPTEAGNYTATVTVQGTSGDPKSGSAAIEVTPVDIQVRSFDFTSEQFVDDDANPGETLTISVLVENNTDEAIVGNASLVGLNLITVTDGSHTGLSVPANGTATITAQVHLPVNYCQDEGRVEFSFATGEVEIVQDLQFNVNFFVELNAVASPVTDRVLNISGRVANPSLTTASLALDGDIDQVFQVNLVNGSFNQDVAMEASASETTHHAVLVADSGCWHEEDELSFTAQVAPAGFRVTLTWDTNGTDVDLWVTGPDGDKCYYGHRTATSGLQLDFDDTSGYGPENITNMTPPAGPYLVQVHYWSDHDSEAAIGTSCSVVIRLNEGTEDEVVHNYYGSLGDTGDIWTVTTLTVGDKGVFGLVEDGQYGVVDPGTLPAK